MRSRLESDEPKLALLRAFGSERMRHHGERSLFDHLTGTAAIADAWKSAEHVRSAALFHSVYGTSVFRAAAASADRRDAIRAVIGERAERLAFAFGLLDRAEFSERIATMAAPQSCALSGRAGPKLVLISEEVVELSLLGLMNELEQTAAGDGSPASWRLRCPSLIAALVRWDTRALPAVVDRALRVPVAAEREDIADYAVALRIFSSDRPAAVALLARLAAAPTGQFEPLAWLALDAARTGEPREAARHAASARARLSVWGTAWDKRLSLDEWRRFLAALGAGNVGAPGLGEGGRITPRIALVGLTHGVAPLAVPE